MLKKFLKSLNQKAQAMILYVLLVPVLFVTGGAGAEIGWYYMNVSRLQNSADSAVIAGVQKFINNPQITNDEGDASEYAYYSFVNDVPKEFRSLKWNEGKPTGDEAAKNYVSRNISNTYNWTQNNSIQDSWTKRDVKFTGNFYAPRDLQTVADDTKYYAYYEVVLEETPNHLFSIFNSFGDMNIRVHSVAKLSSVFENPEDVDHGPNLIEQMEKLKGEKVSSQFYEIMDEYIKFRAKVREELADKIQALINGGMNADEAKAQVEQEWKAKFVEEYIKTGRSRADAEKIADKYLADMTDKEFVNNSNHPAFSQAQDKEISPNGNWWLANLAKYRTEGLTMRGIGGLNYDVKQFNIDDLFVDFKTDLIYAFKEDWDLPLPPPKNLSYNNGYAHIFDGEKDPDNFRHKYRIHGVIHIIPGRVGDSKTPAELQGKYPYKKRQGKTGYDPLYARIESEQIKAYELNGIEKGDFRTYNSVHQIIIEVNVANTGENDRPLVFFYDGPQKFDESSHVRDSKPVILNLNADFNGILYAPNSPVVVAGNGHKFTGFVVAKEFVKLKTAQEFESEGYIEVVRCKMVPVQAEGDETVDNTPIENYNTAFDKNKAYVENNVFVKEENIISAENLPTKDPAEIVKNYIAVTYSGKTCYIKKDCDYFEELKAERVDGKTPTMNVPNIIIRGNPDPNIENETHGDVQISRKISAGRTYTETAKGKDTGDTVFTKEDFKLKSSTYNSFNLLKFVNYLYLNKSEGTDNMFEYERGLHVD